MLLFVKHGRNYTLFCKHPLSALCIKTTFLQVVPAYPGTIRCHDLRSHFKTGGNPRGPAAQHRVSVRAAVVPISPRLPSEQPAPPYCHYYPNRIILARHLKFGDKRSRPSVNNRLTTAHSLSR